MTNQIPEDEFIERYEQQLEQLRSGGQDQTCEYAQVLEQYAVHLRSKKLRLLDAANMDARARLVREEAGDTKVTLAQPPGIRPDEQKCPYCAELIKAEAVLCRHCHSEIPKLGRANPPRRRIPKGYGRLNADERSETLNVPSAVRLARRTEPEAGGYAAVILTLCIVACLIAGGFVAIRPLIPQINAMDPETILKVFGATAVIVLVVAIVIVVARPRADGKTASPLGLALGVGSACIAIYALQVPYFTAVYLMPLALVLSFVALAMRSAIAGGCGLVASIVGIAIICQHQMSLPSLLSKPEVTNSRATSAQTKPVDTEQARALLGDQIRKNMDRPGIPGSMQWTSPDDSTAPPERQSNQWIGLAITASLTDPEQRREIVDGGVKSALEAAMIKQIVLTDENSGRFWTYTVEQAGSSRIELNQ